MESFININMCPHHRPMQPQLYGKVREFFIAAEELEWNYAPSGLNKFNGLPLEDDKYVLIHTDLK